MTEHAIDLIRASSPDFSSLSASLYVPFTARRFANAELVWINRRWMRSIGIDDTDASALRAVEAWLLEQYGVGVPEPIHPDEAFVGPELTFYADRYGATGGTAQGGSGRVGTLGGFNVKGIGRTPLVSPAVDLLHSHGCLWLEEAIREVIYSEIVATEFPYGAVAVVAVIATGIRHYLEDGKAEAERALVIRPNFLRAATLQRSIFFGDAGHPGAEQYADAERTREVWQRLWAPEYEHIRKRLACPTLEGTFFRLGKQYGHGHAVRMWPGPVFTSNVSLDGRLVDFGSMRSLPSWMRAQSKFATHSFGGEAALVRNAASSLETAASRFGHSVKSAELVDAFEDGRNEGFGEALLKHGIGPGSGLWSELNDLFAAQQGQRSTLWEDTSDRWPYDSTHPHARLLEPRPGLDREKLQTRISENLDRIPSGRGKADQVAELIMNELALSSRSSGDFGAFATGDGLRH